MRGMHKRKHIETLTLVRQNHRAIWAKSLGDLHVLYQCFFAALLALFIELKCQNIGHTQITKLSSPRPRHKYLDICNDIQSV